MTKMVFVFLVSGMVAVAPVSASASLALALVTADRVVVASDSRVWEPTCDCAAGYTARKFDVRDGVAFLNTHDPSPHDAWLTVPVIAGERADGLARRVLAATHHRPSVSESRIAVIRFGPPTDIVVMHVRFHPDGRLDVLAESHPPTPSAFALGWQWDTDGSEIAALLKRAGAVLRATPPPSESRMIEMARSILETGASRSPKIGGPSHFAVLDRDGKRSWSTPMRRAESGGPIEWDGTGFWIDASTGTPTFRVGNPTGNRMQWDGTNLAIRSGNVQIDGSGIRLAVPLDALFDEAQAFGFDISDGVLGLSGNDGPVFGRVAFLESSYVGPHTTKLAQTIVDAAYTPTSGGGFANGARLTVSASNSGSTASLVSDATFVGNELTVGGISTDGTGKVVCIKANQQLGTCVGSSLTTSGCTCQ